MWHRRVPAAAAAAAAPVVIPAQRTAKGSTTDDHREREGAALHGWVEGRCEWSLSSPADGQPQPNCRRRCRDAAMSSPPAPSATRWSAGTHATPP